MSTKTPVKIISFLSPSAANICLVCGNEVTEADFRRALFVDGCKTPICLTIEDLFNETVYRGVDCKIVCRTCQRKVSNLSKKKGDLKEEFLKAREEANKMYVRRREKRMSSSTSNQASSKRQLSFRRSCNDDDCLNDKDEDIVGICQVIFWFW